MQFKTTVKIGVVAQRLQRRRGSTKRALWELAKERPRSKKVSDGSADHLALIVVHEAEVVDRSGNNDANGSNPEKNAQSGAGSNL